MALELVPVGCRARADDAAGGDGLLGALRGRRSGPRPDLQTFLQWCAERDLQPLQAVGRGSGSTSGGWSSGYAPTTISRRFNTVAGLYRYAVLDGHLAADLGLKAQWPEAVMDR